MARICKSKGVPCPQPIDRRTPENCAPGCFITEALDGLCVGFVLTNATGKIAWINRVARDLLGLDGCEHRQQSLTKLIQDTELRLFWQRAVRRSEMKMTNVSIRWPRRCELKVSFSPCTRADGRLIGHALLFCDVTTEKTVQISLSEELAGRLLAMTELRSTPPKVAELTTQEMQILSLVGQGSSNQDIAEATSIAVATVRSHLKSIYRKLGIRSRPQAVSYAIRNRLA